MLPCLSQPTGQRQSYVRAQHFFLIGPILFLYYEESLASSNLNSKQFKLHGVRPNFYIMGGLCLLFPELSRIYTKLQTNCNDNRCKLLLATTTINIGFLAYANFTSVKNFYRNQHKTDFKYCFPKSKTHQQRQKMASLFLLIQIVSAFMQKADLNGILEDV